MVEMQEGKRILNKRLTCERIMQAVGFALDEEIPERLTYQRIAALAGVDRMIVRRYYGGIESLLEAYVHFFFDQGIREQVLEGPKEKGGLALLSVFAQGIRSNDRIKKILRWEVCTGRDRIASVLESALLGQVRQTGSQESDDQPARCAFLLSAVLWLIADEKPSGSFIGLQPANDQDWERVNKVLDSVLLIEV